MQKQQLLTFTLPSVQSGTLEIAVTGFGTVDIDGAGAYKTSSHPRAVDRRWPAAPRSSDCKVV